MAPRNIFVLSETFTSVHKWSRRPFIDNPGQPYAFMWSPQVAIVSYIIATSFIEVATYIAFTSLYYYLAMLPGILLTLLTKLYIYNEACLNKIPTVW